MLKTIYTAFAVSLFMLLAFGLFTQNLMLMASVLSVIALADLITGTINKVKEGLQKAKDEGTL